MHVIVIVIPQIAAENMKKCSRYLRYRDAVVFYVILFMILAYYYIFMYFYDIHFHVILIIM